MSSLKVTGRALEAWTGGGAAAAREGKAPDADMSPTKKPAARETWRPAKDRREADLTALLHQNFHVPDTRIRRGCRI